jgi:hypothetical protein
LFFILGFCDDFLGKDLEGFGEEHTYQGKATQKGGEDKYEEAGRGEN